MPRDCLTLSGATLVSSKTRISERDRPSTEDKRFLWTAATFGIIGMTAVEFQRRSALLSHLCMSATVVGSGIAALALPLALLCLFVVATDQTRWSIVRQTEGVPEVE